MLQEIIMFINTKGMYKWELEIIQLICALIKFNKIPGKNLLTLLPRVPTDRVEVFSVRFSLSAWLKLFLPGVGGPGLE